MLDWLLEHLLDFVINVAAGLFLIYMVNNWLKRSGRAKKRFFSNPPTMVAVGEASAQEAWTFRISTDASGKEELKGIHDQVMTLERDSYGVGLGWQEGESEMQGIIIGGGEKGAKRFAKKLEQVPRVKSVEWLGATERSAANNIP